MDREFVKRTYTLCSSATYHICVQGRIDDRYAGLLGGLSIAKTTDDDVPVTMLYGPLVDQTALHGVLNTLYNVMHLPLLRLELVETEEDPMRRPTDCAPTA